MSGPEARRRVPWRCAAAIMTALALATLPAAPAMAQADRAVVTGVGADDMLKLRAGPGTGYRVIVGLPDGTEVIVRDCQRIGGTPWCEIRHAEIRGLTGHVSGHYLRRE